MRSRFYEMVGLSNAALLGILVLQLSRLHLTDHPVVTIMAIAGCALFVFASVMTIVFSRRLETMAKREETINARIHKLLMRWADCCIQYKLGMLKDDDITSFAEELNRDLAKVFDKGDRI
jgi:hypothetical protein